MQVSDATPADPVVLGALIVVASFAIDRITAAVLFLLTYFHALGDPAEISDASARHRTEQRQKFLYYGFAAVLAALVVTHYDVARVMAALKFQPYNKELDFLVTVIVLLGGADRIAALLQSKAPSGLPHQSTPSPLEIKGKVTLEEGRSK